ncbi:MAG TPA: hypothetical protein VFE91_05115 [Nitrososphaerales archaeon]|nr:hypothetical protein [Nitrososphaerales archaeon]
MNRTARAIQGLILFSVLLGPVFLWQVYPLLPPEGFDIVAVGWALFVIDAVMTFLRLKPAFYLGFVLALLALGSSLGETEHYVILQSGQLLPAATLLLGDGAQVLLIILVPYYLWRERKEKDWAWPGAEPQA